jgi:hypothetical protein
MTEGVGRAELLKIKYKDILALETLQAKIKIKKLCRF